MAGLFLLLASSAALAAEPGSAADLVDRAFRNLYADDYVQTLVLASRSRGGQELKRRLQITRKQSERPGRALLRFLYPQAIRRTSVLILENEEGSDDLYIYLPAARLTRHLSTAQRGDSFFGTDLSYEDVEPKRADDWVIEWAQSDEVDSTPCALVELRAKPAYESTYERMVSCIERERAIILWTDFYVRGKRFKRLTIDAANVEQVGERHIPFEMRIETLRRGTLTRVITEKYELQAQIPDDLFNTWNLQTGDAKGDRRRAQPAPAPVGAAGREAGDAAADAESADRADAATSIGAR